MQIIHCSQNIERILEFEYYSSIVHTERTKRRIGTSFAFAISRILCA